MLLKTILVSLLLISKAIAFDHSLWDVELKKYIHPSKEGHGTQVNYLLWKKKITPLNTYLKSLSALSLSEFEKFDHNEKSAFLINAYNSFTVKLILKHYPVKSIKNIGSFFSSPWKKKFFHFLGRKSSLDYIEHQLIRKKYGITMAHFSIVCASISCPPLMPYAFTQKNLSASLKKGASNFLYDSSKNRWDKKKGVLYLSKIFDWFEGDFNQSYHSVKKFLVPYLTKNKNEENILMSQKTKIKYLNYDWKLNDYK